MPSRGGPERRRSLVDILSDLDFLDRRQSEGAVADKPGGAKDAAQPTVDAAAPAAPRIVAEPTEYNGIIAALRDVRQRAAAQRLVAERALEEARALESRIAKQEDHIFAASEIAAQMRLLMQAAEGAAAAERAASDRLRASGVELVRIADERNRAASAHDELLAAEKAAAAEVVRAEAALVGARNTLVDMTAAVASGAALFETVTAQEEAARAEAARADAAVNDVRREREQAEAALNALKEREAAMKGKVSSLDFDEELRALEARIAEPRPASAPAAAVAALAPPGPAVDTMSEFEKRVADRRAADAARRTAS